MTKTYAITGVASGIGAALARQLQTQGHRIIGFDVVETDTHVDHFIQMDLSDARSITQAANAVTEPLDGLCNNAGLPPRDGLEEKILQVNFIGQRLFTHAMLDHLKPDSAIVNLASRAGHKWRENVPQIRRLAGLRKMEDVAGFVAEEEITPVRAYDLSKEAMILWTMAQTEALFARKLRMNSLSPGAVSTAILDDFGRAFGDRMTRNVARAGRAGTADEIARVAAFALSPESGWMKGEDIAIDGGMGAFNLSDALALDPFVLPDGPA